MSHVDRAAAASWFDVLQVEGEVMHGVRARVALHATHGMLIEVRLEAGTRVPAHVHRHESYCYLLDGRVRLRIGDESLVVDPGDAFFHPAGVEHEAEALESSRWVEFKSPPEATW